MKLLIFALMLLTLNSCGSTKEEKKEEPKPAQAPAAPVAASPSNINVYCAPGSSTVTK